MSDKCGCVFCRGELAYVLPNGTELRITEDGTVTVRVPLASVAAQAEHGQQLGDVVVTAGKLFDRCPTCGRQLAEYKQRPTNERTEKCRQLFRIRGMGFLGQA